MTYNSLFSNNLSAHLGFVVTNLSDIHYKKDLKKLKKMHLNRKSKIIAEVHPQHHGTWTN